jgi:hypothetical protein
MRKDAVPAPDYRLDKQNKPVRSQQHSQVAFLPSRTKGHEGRLVFAPYPQQPPALTPATAQRASGLWTPYPQQPPGSNLNHSAGGVALFAASSHGGVMGGRPYAGGAGGRPPAGSTAGRSPRHLGSSGRRNTVPEGVRGGLRDSREPVFGRGEAAGAGSTAGRSPRPTCAGGAGGSLPRRE